MAKKELNRSLLTLTINYYDFYAYLQVLCPISKGRPPPDPCHFVVLFDLAKFLGERKMYFLRKEKGSISWRNKKVFLGKRKIIPLVSQELSFNHYRTGGAMWIRFFCLPGSFFQARGRHKNYVY